VSARVRPGTIAANFQPLGPGCLVLVVGPSGAGKDTLIARVRESLGDCPRIRFPARAITRPPDVTERSVEVSRERFEAECAQGRYALHWSAHGLSYGVPVEIDDMIRAGETVVVNVSRAVIGAARARYARTRVLLIDADPALRARRIASRGRECAEALAERLAREATVPRSFTPDIVICNDGALDAARDRFADALVGLTET
jgi:ribose 1,5-bisphosphokinase